MNIRQMIQTAGVASAVAVGATMMISGVAGADQPPAGAPGACAQGGYAGCSGDGLNGGAGLSSSAVTAFWQELNILQHSTVTAEAVDTSGIVHYGGNALDAFLYALEGGWSFAWVTDTVTTGTAATTQTAAPAAECQVTVAIAAGNADPDSGDVTAAASQAVFEMPCAGVSAYVAGLPTGVTLVSSVPVN